MYCIIHCLLNSLNLLKKNNTKWIEVDENNNNRDIFYTPVILTNNSKTATQPRLVEQKKRYSSLKTQT